MMLLVVLMTLAQSKIFKEHYALAEEIVKYMTLEQKIGQTTQIDYLDITKDGVTKYEKIQEYKLGSILIGGNGAPDNNGNLQKDNYFTATMENWQKVAQSTLNQGIKVAHPKGQVNVKLLLGTDAVHGNQHVVGEILFPHNIGLAATHNPDNFYNAAKWNAKSVKKSGFNFAFAPTVAVSHNYQWGRFYETVGTNPWNIMEYAKYYVMGLQGVKGNYIEGVLGSTKHFLGDGATLNGYDEGNCNIKNFPLFWVNNIKGYIGAIEENTGTVMVSYSAINGLAMSINPILQTELKDNYGFDGFLISDYNAQIKVAFQGQPTSSVKMTIEEAYEKSINSGMDMIMIDGNAEWYQGIYTKLIQEGKVSVDRLNEAVKRILAVKLSMRLIDVPQALADQFNYDQKQPQQESIQDDKDLEYNDALQAAKESLVLLKNLGNVLPIKKETIKYVILLGDRILNINDKPQLYQDFDNIGAQNGGWTIRWQGYNGNDYWTGDLKKSSKASSILDAVKARFPDAQILRTIYTSTSDWDLIGKAREIFWNKMVQNMNYFTKDNTVMIHAIAESPYAEFMGDINVEYCKGTTESVEGCIYNAHINDYMPLQQSTTLELEYDSETVQLINLVRQHDVYIPLVNVLFSGRPMIINNLLPSSNAFIAAWLPGTSGGEAVVQAIFGEFLFKTNPWSNVLPVPWIKSMNSLKNYPIYDTVIPTIPDPLFEEGYGLATTAKKEQYEI